MSTQPQISKLTGISKDAYNEHVYNSGLAYAMQYTQGDTDAVNWMTGTKAYWKWWGNQFSIVDVRYMEIVASLKPVNHCNNQERMKRKETLLAVWKNMHKPEVMHFYPGKDVMDETYTLMMHAVSKEKYAQRVQSKVGSARTF